jgi:hypothetical protein
MTGTFYGTVNIHGVQLDQERAYHQFATRKWLGKPVEVTIRAKRSKRSISQNNTWWGLIVPAIAEEVGYDRSEHDECHYALVARFFGTHTDKISGATVPNARSSKLSTKQFSELIDGTVRWAATDLGLVLPMPDDLY